MEHILDLYAQPYDPAYPLVCVDEKGKELSDTPRGELPMQMGQPARRDYEWKREGSCNLFVAYEPARGYRKVIVTTRRQNQDFAAFLKQLVDEEYPQAKRVRIVCDNLNLHTEGCLYDTFEPAEAKRIFSRLEFHYTPTHASWLNMVEIELGILERQALSGRIGSEEAVRERVAAWEAERNAAGARIQWQFDCGQARSKFHRFYRWRE